jgi:hypothetical protein
MTIFNEAKKWFTRKTNPPQNDPLPNWGERECFSELNAIEGMIQEATLAAETVLNEDNRGYDKLNNLGGDIMTEQLRRQMVRDARVYSFREGLVRQAKTLYTTFGVGTGLIFQARDPDAQKILMEFWNNPNNKKYTSTRGQSAMSDSLLTDGELPLAFFKSPRSLVMRRLDPLEIVDIATDIDDQYQERFYVRKFTPKATVGVTSKPQTLHYKDWRNIDNRKGVTSTGEVITKASYGTAPVYFVKLQEGYLRGYSLFSAMLHWADQHREFMRARASITRAIASTAFKLKIKGGQAAVNSMKTTLQSTRVTGTSETNPAQTPASTWIENAAAELSRMKQETGAQAAQIDGNMLVMMAGASVSVFPHYFGSGESFRLATATSMETPMRKVFESYSKGLIDMWQEIFDYILEDAGVPEDKREVSVEYPEIIFKDMLNAMQALGLLLKEFPDMVASKAVQKKGLNILGFRKAEDILEEIPEIKRERPEDFGLPAFGGVSQKKKKEEGKEGSEEEEQESGLTQSNALILHRKLAEAWKEIVDGN